MRDCHDDMLAFHGDRVTLSAAERTEMRDRRDTNRERVVSGLGRDEEPLPERMKSQGSYAMWTMVQQSQKDYDVDDGVYFTMEDLKGPRGGDRTPADAKEMVRKAVHDDQFTKPPEVRQNCVRVYYQAGYHVDLPVYRVASEEAESQTGKLELASTEWKASDPSSVTEWFLEANKAKSPTTTDGGQMRRIARLLKFFARSRDSWKDCIASGFIITKLVDEEYRSNEEREDISLHDTMKGIHARLQTNLEVDHPTVLAEKLTKGADDARTRFLREKLAEALDILAVLFDSECSMEEARSAWDKVFRTDFFGNRPGSDEDDGNGGGKGLSAAILIKGSEEEASKKAVDKQGGGRYA